MSTAPELPPWGSLPIHPTDPAGSCWMWGEDDELGRLNLLTDERVASAGQLIQTGQRVSLNWPLDQPRLPCFKRQVFEHRLIPKRSGANDDAVTFNTQSGTQIDGFGHFGYQKTGVFYNGRTQKDVEGGGFRGVSSWCDHCIVGRGVFVDYWGWAHAKSKTYDPLTAHSIPFADLKQCLTDQHVELLTGDVLIIRVGYTEASSSADEGKLRELQTSPTFAGLEQSENMKRFLYESGVAMVASDSPAFERWPSAEDYYLHESLLAGWGVPIGEMFDLEELAKTCARLERNSFFFSASPLNVPGGVASPPNAIAIF